MANTNILFVALGLIVAFGLAYMIEPSESEIPPTPAIAHHIWNGTDIDADSYDDTVIFVGDGSIVFEIFPQP